MSVSPDVPAEPGRAGGGRTRAGNGMSRARTGILAGAARCIARYGTRKTTMGDIAREGGVAKATLYNHFRAKPDVYAAVLEAEVDALVRALDGVAEPRGSAAGVAACAAFVAERLASHPVLRRLATAEPELVATLLTPTDNPAWRTARAAATERVSLAQAAGALHAQHDTAAVVDGVLRWSLSYVLWPAPAESIRAAADRLVAGFVAAPAGVGRPAAEPEADTEAREAG